MSTKTQKAIEASYFRATPSRELQALFKLDAETRAENDDFTDAYIEDDYDDGFVPFPNGGHMRLTVDG